MNQVPPLFLPLFVALLQQIAATEIEQFEISSTKDGELNSVQNAEPESVGNIDSLVKTSQGKTTKSPDSTTIAPEGKQYEYDEESLGYGLGLEYRDAPGHEPHHTHSYQDREEDRHRQKARKVKLPFIDRNGCTKPGDIVCNPDDTNGCSYNLCILENESKNLWKKPALTVRTINCPGGQSRGVTADFCNQNTLLLKAAALLHTGKGVHSDYNENSHPPNFINTVDPCIVSNMNCM